MFDRRVALGVTFLALIGVIIAGTIASYRGAFDSTAPVTVRADRAGQTLSAGAVVKLRGVEVGAVERVRTVDEGVEIDVLIKSDSLDRIPEDVTVQIVPPTAFGAKYIQLSDPESNTKKSLRSGAVIGADRVTVEVDQTFQSLVNVLDVARPADVNAALTSLADTLDTRGERIGDLVTRTDTYLRALNPSVDELVADLQDLDDVADTYEQARPDLTSMLTALARTSDTVREEESGLVELSSGLKKFSIQADALLLESGELLTTTLKLTAPVTEVLSRYAPELPCTVLGLASANKLAEAAVGGTQPGITTITRLVPARDPYSFANDLPQIGPGTGPSCNGLPYVTPAEAALAAPEFASGSNPYAGPQPGVTDRTLTTLLNLIVGGGNLL